MSFLLNLSLFLTVLVTVSAVALRNETRELKMSLDVQVGHNLTLTVGKKSFHIYSDIKKNWFEAWTYCKLQEQVLAMVENNEEREQLGAFMKDLGDNQDFWLGANNFASSDRATYAWMASGFPIVFDFQFWCGCQPNNFDGNQHCLSTSIRNDDNGCWKDFGCINAYAFICQSAIP